MVDVMQVCGCSQGSSTPVENQAALMLLPVGHPNSINTPKHKPLLKMLISWK